MLPVSAIVVMELEVGWPKVDKAKLLFAGKFILVFTFLLQVFICVRLGSPPYHAAVVGFVAGGARCGRTKIWGSFRFRCMIALPPHILSSVAASLWCFALLMHVPLVWFGL